MIRSRRSDPFFWSLLSCKLVRGIPFSSCAYSRRGIARSILVELNSRGADPSCVMGAHADPRYSINILFKRVNRGLPMY